MIHSMDYSVGKLSIDYNNKSNINMSNSEMFSSLNL